MTVHLDLADYLLIAEAVLGLPAELIADFNWQLPEGERPLLGEFTIGYVARDSAGVTSNEAEVRVRLYDCMSPYMSAVVDVVLGAGRVSAVMS